MKAERDRCDRRALATLHTPIAKIRRLDMATIFGKPGADLITGTSGNDTIFGWASGGNASSPQPPY